MKVIALTRGRSTIIDNDTYKWASKFKWTALVTRGGHAYAVRTAGSRKQRKFIFLHREIMKCRANKNKLVVDHISRDTLDNRRNNLRMATRGQNVRNRRGNRLKRAEVHSRFKGVFWHKRAKKWMAQIKASGVLKYLGLFEEEIEAAKSYNQAAEEMMGEFACLNEI